MGALLNAALGHLSFTELLASVGGSGLASVGGSPYATSSKSGRNGARFSGIGGIEVVEADAEGVEAGAPFSLPTTPEDLIVGEYSDSASSTLEEEDEMHEVDSREEGDVSDLPDSADDGREDLAMHLGAPVT